MNKYLVICGATVIAACAAAAVQSASLSSVSLDIDAQPLDRAIGAWARQTGYQVLIPAGDETTDLAAPMLKGSYTPEEALKELLASTALTYQFVGSHTVAIRPAGRGGDGGGGASAEKDNDDLAEVVVTAQKRVERLIDTPQVVTVLSSDTLDKLGATQFRDFANNVPGLSLQTAGPGWTQVSLRGVTAGFDVSPTVGVYIDDVPYGSTSSAARAGQLALDAAPYDLDRIEVLSGPQGTLYGASTMGGLIKYVTKRPDTENFTGFATAGMSGTEHGGTNYNVVAGTNVPLATDKVALRVTGFQSHDGGYIDNIALGRNNVDSSNVYGGRLNLLFTPTEALSIRLDGFLQDIDTHGFPLAGRTLQGTPLTGVLDQSRPEPEGFKQKFRLGAGTVSYDFGSAELVSVSAYQTVTSDFTVDLSPVFLALTPFLVNFPVSAVGSAIETTTHKFTQEVRLVSKNAPKLDWTLGAYYSDERSVDGSTFITLNSSGQAVPNNILTTSGPSAVKEYAAFGDATWHFTTKFDVTGGLRYSHTQTHYPIASATGVLAGPLSPDIESSDHVFTYLANARYHFNAHSTGYLRYATGYRNGEPGGFTIDPATRLVIPVQPLKPDNLKSYEIGYKADTDDQRFGVDANIYYIDWKEIQTTASLNGFVQRVNASGGATSKGAELALKARPISALIVTGNVAYADAYMNDAVPALKARAGERLPNVPRFTTAWNADYRLGLGTLQPTLGATVEYVGSRTLSYDASTSPPQYHLPSYTQLDLRLGLSIASFTTQLYVHNALDKAGEIPPRMSGVTPRTGPYYVGIIPPRTFGLTVSKTF